MNKFFLAIFLLSSFQAFSQFDYELLQTYTDKLTRQQNSRLINQTEFQQDKKLWKKTSFQQFNLQGMPTALVQFDQKEKEAQKKEFLYDSTGNISSTETYKQNKHEGSTEFVVNSLGQIISYAEYVFSSDDGEKMFVWQTYLEYNSNGSVSKSIKLEGNKRDTSEINFFNKSGIKTKTLYNYDGLRSTKIEFNWNRDSTEMKEVHFENDSSIYIIITHKYMDNKEVEKIDPGTSNKPFYWKYDDSGRLIETNEQYFYVQYFKYDQDGYLESKTINILFSDSNVKDLPKKVQYKYEHKFRN